MVYGVTCLCVYLRVCVYLCICVRERINVWVTDPLVQLLDSDRRELRIAILRR